MGVFDRFTSKLKVPEGNAEVNVEFTEEESEAIAVSIEQYATNAKAPEGTTVYVHPKAKNGMIAKALAEYVEDLVVQLENCSKNEAIAIMDKAIKAQLKAYAIHNLPVYLFQAAGMFELTGDVQNAKKYFGLFLRAQDEFKPDQVDMSEQKLGSSCQDVSDGLKAAIQEISLRSGVTFTVYGNRLPVHDITKSVAEFCKITVPQLAMSASVDFELLFTIPITARDVCDRVFAKYGLTYTVIGETNSEGRNQMILNGRLIPLPGTEFNHQADDLVEQVIGRA